MNFLNNRTGHYIILIVLAGIWGSSFILMKRGLEHFSSTEVAALRMFIAFIFMLPMALKYLGKIERKSVLPIISVGLLGNFIPAFLFTAAQTGLSSSLTGMLNSLTPLFTLILGVMMFRSKTKWVNVIGIVLGFGGAMGLIISGNGGGESTQPLLGFYVMAATLCYAVSVNIIKTYLQEINSTQIASLAFLFMGPLSAMVLFSTDVIHKVGNDPGALGSLGYISILAIFGTGLSVILFNELIKMTNALFASSVTYLIPVVAIFWGLADGEQIIPGHILSILVILVGIYLVNKKIPAETLVDN